jgi:hypothetical protein
VVGHSIGIDLSIIGAHDCTVLDATGQVTQRFAFDSSSARLQQLEQPLRTIDPSDSAPPVVMEPTGLAWFLPCLYLRAASRRQSCAHQDEQGGPPSAATCRKMRTPIAWIRSPWPRCPLVDPEKLYAVDLSSAALHGLDRLTRQRGRLIESLTARKNRLKALVNGYLPRLMTAAGRPWEPAFRALVAASLSRIVLAGRNATALRSALQDKRSRTAPSEELLRRLHAACEQLAQLYRPILETALLTESFFDDIQGRGGSGVASDGRRGTGGEGARGGHRQAIPGGRPRGSPAHDQRPRRRHGTTILAAVGTPQRIHSQAAFRGWTGAVSHASAAKRVGRPR